MSKGSVCVLSSQTKASAFVTCTRGSSKACLFSSPSAGTAAETLRHFGIEIDELDELDRLVFFDLAQRKAVAAAENEHAFCVAVECGERRMHQGLVIAVFVERIELQIAVQEKRVTGLAFGYDDPLIRRAFGVDDVVDE